MTPTEKRYALAIGELYYYNYHYWRPWDDDDNKENIIMVLVAGISKDEYNGRYFYTLEPMGEAKFDWMKPKFKVPCSDFISPMRVRHIKENTNDERICG